MQSRIAVIVLLIIFAVTFIPQSVVHAENPVNLKLAGSLVGGVPSDVAIQGDYAYVAADAVLSIIDISTPGSLSQVAYLPMEGKATSVAVNGSYAYVTDSGTGSGDANSTLRIIDISTPSSPSEQQTYGHSGWANAVAVSGDYAFLAIDPHGMVVVNVDPANTPSYVTTYACSGQGLADIKIKGNYAYLAKGNAGLEIVNVSAPASPVQAGLHDTAGNTADVAISANGNYAYLADDFGGLRILNIVDMLAISEVGFLSGSLVPNIRGIAVANSTVYMTGRQDFHTVDVSTPSTPIHRGQVDVSGYGYSGIEVIGDYVYKPDEDGGLRIVDISSIASPSIAGTYNTPSLATDVAVIGFGNTLYMTAEEGGLQIIDITNPQSPSVIGTYKTTDLAYALDLDWGLSYATAYVAAGAYLEVVNVTSPSSPTQIGSVYLGFALDVAIRGDYAYVASKNSGLSVVDVITDPANPVKKKKVELVAGDDNTTGVDLNGNYAYAVDLYGLHVIDISNPLTAFKVGSFEITTGGYPFRVFVSGNYAYVAYGGGGLRIIDVSNPALPVETGAYDPAIRYSANDIYVEGHYAYVASDEYGVLVLDVRNPANPTVCGFHEVAGKGTGITMLNGRVFLADYGAGLEWYDFIPEGNVDNNTALELDDAILALQISVGMSPTTSVSLSADVDSNEKLGVAEAIYVLKKLSL